MSTRINDLTAQLLAGKLSASDWAAAVSSHTPTTPSASSYHGSAVPAPRLEPDDTCDHCDASLGDGEGYDGLCGSCADRTNECESCEERVPLAELTTCFRCGDHTCQHCGSADDEGDPCCNSCAHAAEDE